MKLRRLAVVPCLVFVLQGMTGCVPAWVDPDPSAPDVGVQSQEPPPKEEADESDAVYHTLTFDVGDAYTRIPPQSVESGALATHRPLSAGLRVRGMDL